MLGVEPRLTRYKQVALTIKLHPHGVHIRTNSFALSACLRFLAWRNACGFRLRFCSLLLWCCQLGNVVIVLP